MITDGLKFDTIDIGGEHPRVTMRLARGMDAKQAARIETIADIKWQYVIEIIAHAPNNMFRRTNWPDKLKAMLATHHLFFDVIDERCLMYYTDGDVASETYAAAMFAIINNLVDL